MSVTNLHPSYKAKEVDWAFMRDCIAGDSAIKEGKTKYVPQLDGQTDAQYKAYIGRSYFEGYTQRVLDGLTGLMFSKPPIVTVPKQLEDLFQNIDLNNSTLTDYVQDLANEVESVDRVGTLIDNSTNPQDNRPYTRKYPTESILNWKHENINGVTTLTMVVLKETEDTWTDLFTNEITTIYRVLLLAESETIATRHYQQYIYRPDTDNNYSDIPSDVIVPQMNGKVLDYIPFVPITSEKLTIEPNKPPLLDMARVNVAHFKLNTDYYHGMHFTALPTPYGTGIQTKEGDKSFTIGSTSFNFYSNPAAKLAYLEFEGKGLETLENEKEKLIDSMVVLGSNMLQGDKKTAEAENTVAMRSAGQNASLVSTADTISRGVVKILEIMAEWGGWTGEIEYSLNTDYNATSIDASTIKELIVGRTMREIPQSVLIHNVREGELMPEGMTDEDWKLELEEEAPIITESALPAKPANNDVDIDAIAKSVGAK